MQSIETLQAIAPALLSGAWFTVKIALGGTALAFVLSFVVGLASTARNTVVRGIARGYLEFFRGTSVILQMFWIFYALPAITGYTFEPLAAAVVAVGLNLGAYGSEVVRGAIAAVPNAQQEAGIALSFTPPQRLRYVIMPQAFVGMIPPMNNLWIELVKATALATSINIPELMTESSFLAGSYDRTTVLTGALAIYLAIALVITLIMRMIERRAGRIVGREPKPLWRRRKPATPTLTGVSA